MTSRKSLAIILGAGPGTGQALGLAFSKVHNAVALLARRQDSLREVREAIVSQGGQAEGFSCDTSDRKSVDSALEAIQSKWPDHDLKVAVFNATSPFIAKPFLELTAAEIQPGVDVNVLGAFHFAQATLPLLLKAGGGGSLLFSGATAAVRGGAKFAAFAPSKFALRGLSQSLAREFGPQGVHVAHIILDGLIDTERVRGMMGEGKEGSRLDPDSIARSYVHLAEQDRSAWTQELDLRPFAENF